MIPQYSAVLNIFLVNCSTSDSDLDFNDFEESLSLNVRTDKESDSSRSEKSTQILINNESKEINSWNPNKLFSFKDQRVNKLIKSY